MNPLSNVQLVSPGEGFNEYARGSRLHTISSSSYDATNANNRHDTVSQRKNSVKSDPGAFPQQEQPHNRSITSSCCIAGEHFMTSDQIDNYYDGYSKNRNISFTTGSVINVNISDIVGDENTYATTAALKKCKSKVLNPYNVLITVIGWRQFRKGSFNRIWTVFNSIYLLFITLLLLFGYVYQTYSCSGKLNLQTDTIDAPLINIKNATHYTTPSIHHSGAKNKSSMDLSLNGPTNTNQSGISSHLVPRDRFVDECHHFVTTYIIPAILHFSAFCYGVIYFRFQENEQLHSLMERVFLQAQTTMGGQERLIRNCRLFLFGACLWLILVLVDEVIFILAFGHSAILLSHSEMNQTLLTYITSGLGILGVLVQHCVNVAIILNYCTQCEMVVLYTKGICLRLHEKSHELRSIMHEILGLREFVSLVNGALARVTALCVTVASEMTIIGMCLLVLNEIKTVTVYSHRILFVLLWLIGLVFPIVQAARLTKVGRSLCHISFEMKVFGYKNASQLELDSFMLFVNNARLRAKLFGIPVTPGVVMSLTVIIGLTMLLLFQTGVIQNSSYF